MAKSEMWSLREKLNNLWNDYRREGDDDNADIIAQAIDTIDTLRLKDTAEMEDNKTLVGMFVMYLGYDFYDHYEQEDKREDAGRWPKWSDKTKMLWEEIEDRMTTPKCRNFNFDRCMADIEKEIKEMDEMAKQCNYSTSWRIGIAQGLRDARRYIEENIKVVYDGKEVEK